jgi:hypothetical protein
MKSIISFRVLEKDKKEVVKVVRELLKTKNYKLYDKEKKSTKRN